MTKMKKFLRRIALILAVLFALGVLAAAGTNAVVMLSAKRYFLSNEDAAQDADFDAIVVFGCGVTAQGTPTYMLRDRLETAAKLYFEDAAPKILVSGDHGRSDYDEVNVMKRYLIEKGVPSQDVFMDHAGFSSYETVVRAKEVFLCERPLLVTQRYHLYRCVFAARAAGLEAFGVCAEGPVYRGRLLREIREIAARGKECLTALLHPEPTYLGPAVPIYGDGNLTND